MDLNKEIKVVLSYEGSRSRWRNNQTSKEWILSNKVAIAVMGEGLQRKPNCGCIDDLFYMLKTLSNERINQKQIQMNNKFKLVDGKMIQLNGTHYTNANLTDEKAIEILTKFPSHIITFATYPGDWRELCGKVPTDNNVKEDRNPTGREAELISMKRDDLFSLAMNIAESNNELKKPRHNTGSQKLVTFILENEVEGKEAENASDGILQKR